MDLQRCAWKEWEKGERLPVGSKVGFVLNPSPLIHVDCGAECVDVRVVVLRDEPELFHFILIGMCPECADFVWVNKSVDADGRVMTYGEDMEVVEQSVMRKVDP